MSSRCPLLPRDAADLRPRRSSGPMGASRTAPRGSAHPGGDWGYPVFTEFGADLPELLRRAGFEVEVFFGPTRDDDLAQVYVCRKPA